MSTDISHQGLCSLMIQQNRSTSWPYGHSEKATFLLLLEGDFIPGKSECGFVKL